ncbi:phospholipase D family protein [Massilia sp. SYSU DXS3249]
MRAPLFLKGAAALVLVAAATCACTPLPPLEPRPASVALSDTGSTRLGRALAPLAERHPGLSGIHPLADGRDAFAARVLLARAAERSLDVQYYIWRDDLTGVLLFDELRSAATRGVRVRLLIDDNNTAGLDPVLSALGREPNIEVRLFNPFAMRGWRSLGYLTDFRRLNRRMHNKSFTVDSQATIVGGRNIGDEYFGAAGDMLFVDLDVLAVGTVVDEVSQDFDRYWNSASAYPIAALVAPGDVSPVDLGRRAADLRGRPDAQRYLEAVRTLPFVEQLKQGGLPLEWSLTRLVSDNPAKVLGKAAPGERMAVQLSQLWGKPERRLDIVSPYFVPGQQGANALAAAARGGAQIRVLTNSLEATDVAAVHAGYAKWRHELLKAGVSLFELRRSWGADLPERGRGRFGSSASSLHAKTFGVDERSIFIGSFNLDRRSIDLNTEMGFVIDSPVLAGQLHQRLGESMPGRAYEVRLDGDGKLYWLERSGDRMMRHEREPGVGVWKRAWVGLLSFLPIDWLL